MENIVNKVFNAVLEMPMKDITEHKVREMVDQELETMKQTMFSEVMDKLILHFSNKQPKAAEPLPGKPGVDPRAPLPNAGPEAPQTPRNYTGSGALYS